MPFYSRIVVRVLAKDKLNGKIVGKAQHARKALLGGRGAAGEVGLALLLATLYQLRRHHQRPHIMLPHHPPERLPGKKKVGKRNREKRRQRSHEKEEEEEEEEIELVFFLESIEDCDCNACSAIKKKACHK